MTTMPSGSVQVAPVGQTFVQGGVAALLAGDRHVEVALLGHLARAGSTGRRRVKSTPFSLSIESTRIHWTCGSRDWLFSVDAGVDAAAAADAARDVERVARTCTPGIGPACRPPSRPCRTARVYSRSISASGRAQAVLRDLVQALRAAGRQQEAGGRGGRARRELAARHAVDGRRRLVSGVHRRTPHCATSPGRAGGAGAGFGSSGLKRGWCGLWQLRAQQVASCARSTRRCAGRARRPASRGASRRGTGRTAGTTRRTTRARRSPGAARRGSSASWQSRHQRCSLVVRQHDVGRASSVSVAARAVRPSGPAWQAEHGKMPSENGGGGTSRRSSAGRGRLAPARCGRPPVAATDATAARPATAARGRHAPHAALRRQARGSSTHALHLAQPHRLEHLQPLADHRRDVPRDDVAHARDARRSARAAPPAGSASTSVSSGAVAFSVKRCGGMSADQPSVWPGRRSSTRMSSSLPAHLHRAASARCGRAR